MHKMFFFLLLASFWGYFESFFGFFLEHNLKFNVNDDRQNMLMVNNLFFVFFLFKIFLGFFKVPYLVAL